MLKLASLFSNHAVLQAGIAIPVWGWTEPRTMVECHLGDQQARVLSNPDGKFLLRLHPMSYGGPYMLSVRNVKSGESVSVGDVMIGEVWLASGQSNMEWTPMALGLKPGDVVAGDEMPPVRMITVPRCARVGGRSDFRGQWELTDPESVMKFSAVAFHFSCELAAKLGVTVGVVNSSWGGTLAEAWSSRESLVRNPDFRAQVLSYEDRLYEFGEWDNEPDCDVFDSSALLPRILAGLTVPPNAGLENGWAETDFDDRDWKKMTLPGSWMIAGEKYNGVLWFRRTVEIPAEWAGRELILSLGAVDKQDITYFNGVRIGATGEGLDVNCWNIHRRYRIAGDLVKNGRAVIAVRAFSFVFDGGLIGPRDLMYLSPADSPDEKLALTGEWNFAAEVNMGLVSIPAMPTIPRPGVANLPYMLYDNMITPLLPYAIRGVIWYQGEQNAANWPSYQRLMRDLIADWRRAWGQGDIPFYQVQLANYRVPMAYQADSEWAYIREAQLQAGQENGCGVAVTIDIGEEMNIHPLNKIDVGRRLAQLALSNDYQRPVTPSGPVYRDMTIEGNRIRLKFDCADGLKLNPELPGLFMIADATREFKPAEVEIQGNTVVVGHPDMAFPVAVRYAWADNPFGALLYNGAGLPASPFRTDTWSGTPLG